MYWKRSAITLIIGLGLVALLAACGTAPGNENDPGDPDNGDPDDRVIDEPEPGEEITTGSLRIEITGLPEGLDPVVTVTLSGDTVDSPTASTILEELDPGDYTITATDVASGPYAYLATVTPPTPVTVAAGEEAGPVTVEYARSSTVRVMTDVDDGDVTGSLRNLLAEAGTPGANIERIEFDEAAFPAPADPVIRLEDELAVVEGTEITLVGGVAEEGGLGTVRIEAAVGSRVLDVPAEAVIELRDLTLVGGDVSENAGTSADLGGVIRNAGELSLRNVTVRGGVARRGGGIYNTNHLTLDKSSVVSNVATHSGGGVAVPGTATIVVTASTFSGNEARDEHGGGLWANGPANVSIINSTFSGNRAGTYGGAISAGNNVRLRFSTVVGNTGGTNGTNPIGGVSANYINMLGSVVAGNMTEGGSSPDDLYLNYEGDETRILFSVIGRPGNFAVGEVGKDASNLVLADQSPRVNDLASNGGPTQTMTLHTLSPARNFVPHVMCRHVGTHFLTVDQRGEPRPNGDHCDAGAVEMW